MGNSSLQQIQVIKIGGNVIDDPDQLKSFIDNFSKIEGFKILIHGGGKEATRLSEALGISTTMIDGRRVTDGATLEVVTMTYAGLINKRIVSMLQSAGCNAIGFSGADGNMMPAKMRCKHPVDYGYVGDINPADVNIGLLNTLLEAGIVPVLCAICHDGAGQLLNCNADSVASAMAIAASAIGPVRLTYCFEKPGVLRDVDNDTSIIPIITEESFRQLLDEGIIAKGMIPKLRNALDAIKKGVDEVRICKASDILQKSGSLVK